MQACPRRPAPRPSAPSRLRACAPRPPRTCTWTSRASPRGARPSSACPPRPRSAGRPRRGGGRGPSPRERGSRPACGPAAAPASPIRRHRLRASSPRLRPSQRGRRPRRSRASEPRTSRRSRPTRRRRRACVPERLWPCRKSRKLVRMGLDIRYARSGAVAIAYHPEGQSEQPRIELSKLRDSWGTQEFSDQILIENAPTRYEDPAEREWFANWLRVGASPAVAYELNRAFFETDLRDILPAVRVPALVLYRPGYYEASALDVADRIPEAARLRVSGTESWGIFYSPEIPDEIERFVAGERPPEVPDTVLATMLFTDLVGSTERAAELGDRSWRELLQRHHALVRRELTRYRGEEKDTAGDGCFATFDGPARAIRCAHAIVDGVHELGLEVRAGVHTGECEVHENKVAGLAVVIGARVAALAGGGEVRVPPTVKDLVAGAGVDFDERGEHELKGVPGSWRLYSVADVSAHGEQARS